MKSITVSTVSETTPPEPMLEHAIRLRAYELYVQRGMAEGDAVQDWLEAEAELLYSLSPLHDCGTLEPGIKALKVN
jgi:hypothetical protein